MPAIVVAEGRTECQLPEALWGCVARAEAVPIVSSGYVRPERGPTLAYLVPADKFIALLRRAARATEPA